VVHAESGCATSRCGTAAHSFKKNVASGWCLAAFACPPIISRPSHTRRSAVQRTPSVWRPLAFCAAGSTAAFWLAASAADEREQTGSPIPSLRSKLGLGHAATRAPAWTEDLPLGVRQVAQQLYRSWMGLSPSHRAVMNIIAVNAGVYLLWRLPLMKVMPAAACPPRSPATPPARRLRCPGAAVLLLACRACSAAPRVRATALALAAGGMHCEPRGGPPAPPFPLQRAGALAQQPLCLGAAPYAGAAAGFSGPCARRASATHIWSRRCRRSARARSPC